jgi:pimeloyl-ACP methyl ester carboxylesterase
MKRTLMGLLRRFTASPAKGGSATGGDPNSVRGSISPFPYQTTITYDQRFPAGQGDVVIHHRAKDLAQERPDVLIAFIHGGGWRQGGPDGDGNLPAWTFRKPGVGFASIGYRLSPDGSAPMTRWSANRFKYDHVRDCARGLAAALQRVPAKRVILMGHSAGAHLAALLCSKVSLLEEASIAPERIIGGIILDTAFYDLVNRYRAVPDLIANAFGILPMFSPGAAANLDYKSQSEGVFTMNQYSPQLHITSRSRPQAVVNSGPSSEQNLGMQYVQALLKAGISKCSYVAYPGNTCYEHNEVLTAVGNPSDPPAGSRLPAGSLTVTQFCDLAVNTWLASTANG